jgi:ectoine hydroxylase-related dioxygenase (phytanoyl-CoA dioxygenase family)
MKTETIELSSTYLDAINKNSDRSTLPIAGIEDIELNWPCAPEDAAHIYREYGCLVVRGLLADLAPQILADAEEMARQVKESNFTRTGNALVMDGDKTGREKQIMLFCPTYTYAASHFQAATDSRVLDLLEALIGPNIEMMGDGMCMYKEPGGGMEKAMHQDAPYFYHRDHSVCSAFVHIVTTNEENGCLRVYPGSFKLGLLEH